MTFLERLVISLLAWEVEHWGRREKGGADLYEAFAGVVVGIDVVGEGFEDGLHIRSRHRDDTINICWILPSIGSLHSFTDHHMSFSPKPGCPLCSIVATALHAPSNSPRSPAFPAGSVQPELLWRDDNFTAYREKANPVSSKGHIIIAFKSVRF